MLTFFLSLGVAFQGYAGARIMHGSCSMSHVHATQEMPDHAAHFSGHSVLHDEGHAADGADDAHAGALAMAAGEAAHCACIAGCHAVNSLPAAPALVVRVLPVVAPTPAWVAQQFRSLAVSPHWRPPALV